MKKYLQITLIILIIVLVKLLSNITINSISINSYEKGNYNTNLNNSLYFLNIQEPYLPYYNEGTILYQQEKYDDAIKKFNEALAHKPSQKHICDIRVNLALSMVAKIDLEDCKNSPKKIDKVLEVLKENSCSENDDNAKKLKKELESIKKNLQENCDGGGDDGDDGDDNNDGDDSEENNKEQEQKEKEIEEKLKEQQKDSMESRNKDNTYIESEYVYNRDNKRW